jgi:Fe-S-cluster-containing dehydrogenase component
MGAATGAGLSAVANVNAGTLKQFKGYPESMGVLHDTTRCVGCRKCEEACNSVNELPKPQTSFDDLTVLDETRRTTPEAFTVVNKYTCDDDRTVFRKIQCNHCLEPACASVCFVRAFKKSETGAVKYDPVVCVGCRYCMIACPFDIPTYEYNEPLTPRVRKCTLCAPRIEKGQLPGCVEACPKEALIFGKRSDLITLARERIMKHPDTYVDHIYGESEMGGTSWLYMSAVPFTSIGMRDDLGSNPAPQLTSGALSVVPMVVGLWPVFLAGMYGMTQRREKIASSEMDDAVAHAVEEANSAADKKMNAALEKMESEKRKITEKFEKEKVQAVKDALDAVAKNPEPKGEE